ncbi:MAG: ABC transporter substrate-binding protein [Nitrospinota bacterium]|nr:ABC transporter substrate-binding protein [Nitrospinota bacterium]HJN01678.1 ABC transporter substrate-binding protein [Nitrospinota bacterium]
MRIFLYFFLPAAVFIHLGCSKNELKNKNILIIGMENSPTNLDPRFALDLASSQVIQLIFNSLLTYDINGNLIPDLAEKWEIFNNTEYIFYLKKEVRFHDGLEMTSVDIKFTYDFVLSTKNQSPKIGGLEKLKRIEIIDKYTIKFILSEAFGPFLSNLTLPIIPRHVVEKMGDDFVKHPVGTGPFKFSSFDINDKIVLKANKNYFNNPPRLNGIIFKILPDETVRLLELEKGNVQLLQNAISPDILPRLKKNNRLKIIKRPGTNYSYIGFNLKDPILKNQMVREAIATGIDRDSIIEHILKNLATKASFMLSPFNWAYEAMVKTYQYDPKIAKKLLDKAGYPDPDGDGPEPRFTLSYKTSQNELRKLIAEVFQEQLREIGIKIIIKSYEWGTFFSDIKSGNFQIYSLTWVGINDPDIFHYTFHSESYPPKGANRGKYSNKDINELIDKGRKEINIEARKKIYSLIQKKLSKEIPYVSLWFATNIAVMLKEVQGFQLYPDESLNSIKNVYFKLR